MTDVGWVKAGDLQVGQQLVTSAGQVATLTATRAEPHSEGITVYNFTVDGDHTYFVTDVADDQAVWVHNQEAPPTPPPAGSNPGAGMGPVKPIAPKPNPPRMVSGYKVVGTGHHDLPVSIWPEGWSHEAYEMFDKSTIQPPSGTGHNMTDHGPKNGYTKWVKDEMDTQVSLFRNKFGITGDLSPAQQKHFAEEFIARIRNMPADTPIGGFRAAVKRGGAAAVDAWKAARLNIVADAMKKAAGEKLAKIASKKTTKTILGAIPGISFVISLWDLPARADTYGGWTAAGMTVLDNVPIADIALAGAEAGDQMREDQRKAEAQMQNELRRLADELGTD